MSEPGYVYCTGCEQWVPVTEATYYPADAEWWCEHCEKREAEARAQAAAEARGDG